MAFGKMKQIMFAKNVTSHVVNAILKVLLQIAPNVQVIESSMKASASNAVIFLGCSTLLRMAYAMKYVEMAWTMDRLNVMMAMYAEGMGALRNAK